MERRRPLFALCIACLILGGFFRVFHIDWKLYSLDETVTSLRAAGHTYADFERFVHDNRTHRLSELEAYQTPTSQTSNAAIWKSLALEDPQHPPLYFYLTSFTQRMLGDSVLIRRAPAVFFGLLVLPAAWWLAFELFSDRLTAWCFAALVAVSPFHVVYAQQAREYSLWTLLTLLSSATLLRTLRIPGGGGWRGSVGYGVSIALGLWSFLFFLEVCVAHLAFLAISTNTVPWRKRFGLLLALVLGSVSFAPWFNVLLRGVGIVATDTGWTSSPLPPVLYLGKWVFNIGSVFFDLDYLTVLFLPVALIFIGLGAWCTYTLYRRSEARIWSFVVFLGGISAGALVGPDVLLHQSRAGQSRYLTPLWLALELAAAYALARNWSAVGRAGVAWRTATVSLFVAGIASCGTSSLARTWWLANNEKTLPAIGDALSMKARPTLVYVDDDDMLLELLPMVRSPLQFSLHRRIDAPTLASAIQPFAIAKPFEIEGTKARTAPHLITLRPSFPPSQDRAIQVLRRQAASVRKIGSAYEDAQLYAL